MRLVLGNDQGSKLLLQKELLFFHLQLLLLLLCLDEVVIPRKPSEICDIKAVIKVNVSSHKDKWFSR